MGALVGSYSVERFIMWKNAVLMVCHQHPDVVEFKIAKEFLVLNWRQYARAPSSSKRYLSVSLLLPIALESRQRGACGGSTVRGLVSVWRPVDGLWAGRINTRADGESWLWHLSLHPFTSPMIPSAFQAVCHRELQHMSFNIQVHLW